MNKPMAAGIAIVGFCAFMGLYVWLGAQPDPTGLHQIKADFVGCQDQATIEQMRKLASEGDPKAATRLANQELESGNCIRLFPGNHVYVEDITLGGLTKMRLQGRPAHYWTISKFVGP